jgi:hypothetical protein
MRRAKASEIVAEAKGGSGEQAGRSRCAGAGNVLLDVLLLLLLLLLLRRGVGEGSEGRQAVLD